MVLAYEQIFIGTFFCFILVLSRSFTDCSDKKFVPITCVIRNLFLSEIILESVGAVGFRQQKFLIKI